MTTLNAVSATTDNLTLESVQKAFNHWRSNSLGNGKKKIPDYLWQQVLAILPRYRRSEIIVALKVNHAQMRKHAPLIASHQPVLKHAPITKQKATQPPLDFVKAFLPAPAENLCQVDWQRPDGAQLTITHLDTAGLSLLIQNWRN